MLSIRVHNRAIALISSTSLCLLISVGLLFCDGCNKTLTGKTAVSSSTLTLDDKDMLVNVFGSKEYKLFNGVYPDRWPAWLKLPDQFYLRKDGAIVAETKTDMLIAEGFARTPSDQIAKYFTDLFDSQNIVYNIERDVAPVSGTDILVKQPPDNINEIEIITGADDFDTSLTCLQVRLYFSDLR
jgi:hypothetical protein